MFSCRCTRSTSYASDYTELSSDFPVEVGRILPDFSREVIRLNCVWYLECIIWSYRKLHDVVVLSYCLNLKKAANTAQHFGVCPPLIPPLPSFFLPLPLFYYPLFFLFFPLIPVVHFLPFLFYRLEKLACILLLLVLLFCLVFKGWKVTRVEKLIQWWRWPRLPIIELHQMTPSSHGTLIIWGLLTLHQLLKLIASLYTP